MEKQYLLSVDQSTQGTKALLFDREGNLICGGDLPHRQIINDAGWVSHDLNEIYANTLKVVRDVIEKAGIRREQVAGLGISNQRETSAVRDRTDGHPLADAIVWQCSRAKDICVRVEESGKAEWVRRTTGINLSPFFPASKLAWFMENVKKCGGMRVGVCFFLGGIFFWGGGCKRHPRGSWAWGLWTGMPGKGND